MIKFGIRFGMGMMNSNLWHQVEEQFWNQIWHMNMMKHNIFSTRQIKVQVEARAYYQVLSKLWADIENPIAEQLEIQIWNQIWDEYRDKILSELD